MEDYEYCKGCMNYYYENIKAWGIDYCGVWEQREPMKLVCREAQKKKLDIAEYIKRPNCTDGIPAYRIADIIDVYKSAEYKKKDKDLSVDETIDAITIYKEYEDMEYNKKVEYFRGRMRDRSMAKSAQLHKEKQ